MCVQMFWWLDLNIFQGSAHGTGKLVLGNINEEASEWVL